MKKVIITALAIACFAISQNTTAQNQDISTIISSSKNYSRLQDALKMADLTSTLKEKGEYTLFAPSNLAFDKLAPSNTLDDLKKIENKEQLRGALSYLILKEKLNLSQISKLIKDGKGKAEFETLENGKIKVSLDGQKIKLTDEQGNHAYIIGKAKNASNGIVYEIDQMLLPKKKG